MDLEAQAEMIQGFVDKGNFHAAYNLALSALNECRRRQDQAGIDRFLQVIQRIVDTLAAEFGSKPSKQAEN